MGGLAETEVIVIVALSLTLITILIHAIGLISPYWVFREVSGTQYNRGLWQTCTTVNSLEECSDITGKDSWLEAAEALEVIGIILLCLATIGFFIHIFVLRGDRVLYIIIAITLFISGVFILVGAAIYASNVGTDVGSVHFAFALCLAAAVLAVITGFVMIVYLLCTWSTKTSDLEWGQAGPSNSRWTTSRGKSRSPIINDTDDVNNESEDRSRTPARRTPTAETPIQTANQEASTSRAHETNQAPSPSRARDSNHGDTGQPRGICWCCCKGKDVTDEEEESEHQQESQDQQTILQEYDEHEESAGKVDDQHQNDEKEDDTKSNKSGSKKPDKTEENRETVSKTTEKGEEKDVKKTTDNKQKAKEEMDDDRTSLRPSSLADIKEQEENVVVLQKDDPTQPKESSTDEPDEALYAQVHPETSDTTKQQEPELQKEGTTLKENETLVVVPEDEGDGTRKKRGTVFKFRRPPLKRSESDGTVLKAKVQLYEVSKKDNKMVLVSSDYVPDEDIQSIDSSNNRSGYGNRQSSQIDETPFEDDEDERRRSHTEKETSSEFEDETGEHPYKTIKIKTKKKTKRVKVKGVFGNPVHTPYGYASQNEDNTQIVKYLKASPYFSSVPEQPVRPKPSSDEQDGDKPKWRI